MTGIVRKLAPNPERPGSGYGFIAVAGGVPDHFFHAGSLQVSPGVMFADLHVGDRVEFMSIDGERGKGPRAIEVRVLR